jgi:hypothetical protein
MVVNVFNHIHTNTINAFYKAFYGDV